MAKKNLDLDADMEKESGGLGRFLFIATPILFTLVLVGAIVMLFNVNLRTTMFDTLEKIPIVKNWVPSADKGNSTDIASNQSESDAATVDQLKQQLDESKKVQATQAQELKKLQDQLKSQTPPTNEGGTGTATTPAAGTTPAAAASTVTTPTEQDKQLKNLANVYSDMSASKAAAIMQNMTTDEQVLIFSKMNSQDQASILQKMDPKAAADTSLALKNATTASLAALQAQTNSKPTTAPISTKLDNEALAQTFTTMPASSAASLLLQTAKVSQSKVLQILNTIDDSTRAGILSAMSTEDPAGTAQIVNRLMAN
ncbi:MotE family protein [Paenibacillus sp. Z6-24]